MAKHKRPSGDLVEDAEVVTQPAEAVEAKIVAPKLKDGEVCADILTEHGVHVARIAIPEARKGFRIEHDGATWEHVSDHADGTWQYRKL